MSAYASEAEAERGHELRAIVLNLRGLEGFVVIVAECEEVTLLHLILVGNVDVAALVALSEAEGKAVDRSPVRVVSL